MNLIRKFFGNDESLHDFVSVLSWGLCILVLALGGIVLASSAFATERVSLSYAYIDDGGCPKPGQTIEGSYRLATENMDAYGSVRTAPSGGDCRTDALTYDVEIERRFSINEHINALAKFGADERSMASPYAITDGMGNVLLRPDGGASAPVVLPAGRAKTIEAIFGVSAYLGPVNVDLGYNLVPVDWSDGSSSGAFHAGVSVFRQLVSGQLDVSVGLNHGNGSFGDARVAWTRNFQDSTWGVQMAMTYAWGLNELDDGSPPEATFAGLRAVLAGSPQDDATTFSVGISKEL